MNRLSRYLLKRVSVLTLLMFAFATFSVYAQNTVYIPVDASYATSVNVLNNVIPELNTLQSNLRTAQNTLKSLETIAAPIHSQVMPSNMEAMSIAERVKAILKNSVNLLAPTEQTTAHIQSGANPLELSLDQQLAYGVEQISTQVTKIEISGDATKIVQTLKALLANVTEKLQSVITTLRAKIFALGQKVGLIEQDKVFKDGKVVDKNSDSLGKIESKNAVQYSDTFTDKLSQGVSKGVESAKSSLKSSFSLPNLAITATVAVGTNLAIDMIHGNKPSFSNAIKSVASLEFAGNVVGAALGAAGGQFTSTLVQTFVPGPIGALVGAVIPVMFASSGGQMGANLIHGLKSGNFSVSQAWKQIDKVDLVGSSIGSTIGMALGAPIPVIGPIIGGIVGGYLGSRVAKLISNFVGKTQQTSILSKTPILNKPISIGAVAGSSSLLPAATAQTNATLSVSAETPEIINAQIKAIEDKYFELYLQYNRMLDAGEHESAKNIQAELQAYSDQYNALKKELKN